MNKFMREAIKEAETGVKKGHGGPFGAVVVCRGKIIARGHNEVILHNDPTNHAEIVAIRKAAKKLKRFDLGDCEMFITCEPCPMCLGAVYWAKIKKITFGCTRKDAAKIGFDDEFIYDVFRGGAPGKGEAANKGKAARKGNAIKKGKAARKGNAIKKGKAARAAEASTEQVRTVKKYRKECLKVFDAFVKKQDKVMY